MTNSLLVNGSLYILIEMVPRSKYDLNKPAHIKVHRDLAEWYHKEYGDSAQEKMRDILQAHRVMTEKIKNLIDPRGTEGGC